MERKGISEAGLMTPPLYLIPGSRTGAVKTRGRSNASLRLEYGDHAWLVSESARYGNVLARPARHATRSALAPLVRAARAVAAFLF